MITTLRSHPGAKDIPVLQGDFTTTPLGTKYQLIYSLVSTFFLLPSLELQQACFLNIARHLRPGGLFVSEAYVTTNSFPGTDSSTIPIITPSGIKDYHVTFLATPLNILDSMARQAGLRVAERWSNWLNAPYSPTKPRHISVYTPEEHHTTQHTTIAG